MVYVLGFHCYQLLFPHSLYPFDILGLLSLVTMRLCRMTLARRELMADGSPPARGFLASVCRRQIFSQTFSVEMLLLALSSELSVQYIIFLPCRTLAVFHWGNTAQVGC